jgi:hypothetical protein
MTAAIVKQFKAEGGFVTGPESNFGVITATRLEVDNLRLDLNTITATNTNGNINLVTTGTGAVVIDRLAVNTVNAFAITGNLTGNVTGNLTGNVTGNLTGNVTGNIISTGISAFNNASISGGSINATTIGNSTATTGRFTALTATTSITGPIGNVTKNTGQFTFLTADNNVTLSSETESVSVSSGALTVSGGVGIVKNVNIGGELTVTGTVSAATPVESNDVTTKIYVDTANIKNLAYAVAFGL